MHPKKERNFSPYYDKSKVLADPDSLYILDKIGKTLYFFKECLWEYHKYFSVAWWCTEVYGSVTASVVISISL